MNIVREFKRALNDLTYLLTNPPKEDQQAQKRFEFRIKRKALHLKDIESKIRQLKKMSWDLIPYLEDDKSGAVEMLYLIQKIDAENALEHIKKIAHVIKDLKSQDSEEIQQKNLKIPAIIRPEIESDLNEIRKCFKAGSYRSVIILCGRILEITLHRKYFEATGRDILETQPGIGLGTLIAKLREKNVRFEPGINEQIHLVNKVRISSVHKKSEVFNPSMQQTKAIMLFTMDIIGKTFS